MSKTKAEKIVKILQFFRHDEKGSNKKLEQKLEKYLD